MYHRFGHAQQHFVKLGDKVKKGQKILSIGTGNNQWSAHCHKDTLYEKLKNWRSYTFGMTKDQVSKIHAPVSMAEIKIIMPTFDHFGYEHLERANYGTTENPKWCFHPGVDLNGKGSGNSDLGDFIYSPCDGIVVHDDNDGKAYNGGWGRLLVIEEITEEKKQEIITEQTPKIESVPVPEKNETIESIPEIIKEEKPKETEKEVAVESEKSEVVQVDLNFILKKLFEFIYNKFFKK